MTGKKLEEARRLRDYANTSGMGLNATITPVSETWLVSILIKGKRYSYVINTAKLEGSEEHRNKQFAKFIVNSMLNSAYRFRKRR